MFEIVNERVFPFLRTLGGEDSTYSKHMEGARFTISTAGLLDRVVQMLDAVPMGRGKFEMGLGFILSLPSARGITQAARQVMKMRRG